MEKKKKKKKKITTTTALIKCCATPFPSGHWRRVRNIVTKSKGCSWAVK